MKKKKNELYFELPDKEHNLVIDTRDDGRVYFEEPDDEAIEISNTSYTDAGFINFDDSNLDLELKYEDQDPEVKKMLDSLDDIYKDLK